jgi:molybdopterin molybdotransferase
VAILSTGDELVGINEPLGPGQIRNSNSYSLAAQVLRYGGIPVQLGIAKDVVNELTVKIRQCQGCDMLLTSGGVSMGDYDVVKDVLAIEGEIGFWLVRMKPGKPLAFGRIGSVPHIGLPGNPVSSMVVFEQFGRPAILKMLGKTNFQKPEVQAILDTPATNSDGRRCYYRAWVEYRDGAWHARLTGPQGSGILTSMMLANGLVIIPEHRARVNAGEVVRTQMLDWPEEVVI